MRECGGDDLSSMPPRARSKSSSVDYTCRPGFTRRRRIPGMSGPVRSGPVCEVPVHRDVALPSNGMTSKFAFRRDGHGGIEARYSVLVDSAKTVMAAGRKQRT